MTAIPARPSYRHWIGDTRYRFLHSQHVLRLEAELSELRALAKCPPDVIGWRPAPATVAAWLRVTAHPFPNGQAAVSVAP